MKNHGKLALTIGIVGLALVLTAATGCHHKSTPINPNMTTNTAPAAPSGASGTGQPNLSANELQQMVFNPMTGVKTIHFDFDSAALRPEALDILKHNASVIKSAPGVIVQIAGNCDERGTQEYNLALGEKRADAARDYLIKLGVPASQLITISYGKENPVDPGHNEAAWAKNRRDDFLKGTPAAK